MRRAAAPAAAAALLMLAACDSLQGRLHGGRVFTIPGCSMAPAIKSGGKISVKKAYPDELRRGNIVVFNVPSRDLGEFVARIVAVGGDRVEFDAEGRLILKGASADEPYLNQDPLPRGLGQRPAETIPRKSYFVVGDNRGNSSDSRFFGPVPYDDIVGKGSIIKRGDSDSC